jgi:hypothetical protein
MQQTSGPHAGEDYAFMAGIGWLGHITESHVKLAKITPEGTPKV